MPLYDLTPHWTPLATRVAGALAGALLLGTLATLIVRISARTERQQAVARDLSSRAVGWWIVLLILVPGGLAGGAVMLVLFAFAALVAWHEFVALRDDAAFARWELGWTIPLVAVFFGVALPSRGVGGLWPGLLLAGVVWLAARLVHRRPGRSALWRATGWLACVVPLGSAALIALKFGTAWLVFVIVIPQAADVLQYVFGKAFGRHRLAPRISPGKTWEGLIGGLLSAMAIGGLLAPLIDQTRLVAVVWGAALAVAGALAGLGMSAAKRLHGAKGFGRWLPGHGGLLDRFDSLCGAALVAYLWLAW